jgi:hypothetical protein
MQKLNLCVTTKMSLSLTVTLTDIIHVFIQKCKSRITRHIKVKTLKRKWSHNSDSYTFKKEKTPTSIYLHFTWLQVLCSFTLATHLPRENETLWTSIVLHYSLEKIQCVHKKYFYWLLVDEFYNTCIQLPDEQIELSVIIFCIFLLFLFFGWTRLWN